MSNYMIGTTIKVQGPGGCINFEVGVIRRAFKELGIDITIENDYSDKPTFTSTDELVKAADFRKENWSIKLIADHQPWGG